MELESRASARVPEAQRPPEAPAALGVIEQIVSAAGIIELEPEAPEVIAPPARPPAAAGEETHQAEAIAKLESWLNAVRRAKEARR